LTHRSLAEVKAFYCHWSSGSTFNKYCSCHFSDWTWNTSYRYEKTDKCSFFSRWRPDKKV